MSALSSWKAPVCSVLCGLVVAGCINSVPIQYPSVGENAALAWPLGTWDVVFVCTDFCTGTFNHTMRITQFDSATGAFSAQGVQDDDETYKWTADGGITPPTVAFSLKYIGGANLGYVAQQTGAVSADGGVMSGEGTTSQHQTLDWSATRRP